MKKKNILLLILSIASISLFAQHEIQFEKKHFETGETRSEIHFYKKGNKQIREGKSYWWYKTGELKNTISYKNEETEIERISYWRNGKIKRKDILKNGKLKNGKCFDENGKKIKYYDFEINPEFPRGTKAFKKFLNKKLISGANSAKGKLVIRFDIEPNGEIFKFKILEDTNPSLKNEVTKMFNDMPNWKPAMQDGIPVRVTRTIPIHFN